MKENDLTPRAFVGQPLPVAGLLDGRRRACPTIQMTRRARTRTSRTLAYGVAAAGDGGSYNRH